MEVVEFYSFFKLNTISTFKKKAVTFLFKENVNSLFNSNSKDTICVSASDFHYDINIDDCKNSVILVNILLTIYFNSTGSFQTL